jgi:GTP cyclohydrolase I
VKIRRPPQICQPDRIDKTSTALHGAVGHREKISMASTNKLARIATDGHYADSFEPETDNEVYDPVKEDLVRRMLAEIGEDAEREGLRRTPLRVAKAMDFLTSGYQMSAEEIIKKAVFEEDVKEMVIVRDIEFYSMCEHHMLPFFGHAHVGYLPNGKVVGLSKIARVVDVFARRLQVQERLTTQVADALMQHLGAHGVAVVIEASHTCMMMRGVQKQNSTTVSSAMRGTFEEDPRTRAEFMGFLHK